MENSLYIQQPEQTAKDLTTFLRNCFATAGKQKAVIAVSGGIDSALATTLLAQALSPSQVTALFLPYQDQSTADAQLICDHVHIPQENRLTLPITQIVETTQQTLPKQMADEDTSLVSVRNGNLMARARMLLVYDTAKRLNALVCGTENKSEHYLGYFTRFGDAASDIEPISTLYKTQVRQLVEFLQLPAVFLSKAPSAGLWQGQTDEQEMGFTYEQADQVLYQLVDEQRPENQIQVEGVPLKIVQRILAHISSMRFKLTVPYVLTSPSSSDQPH